MNPIRQALIRLLLPNDVNPRNRQLALARPAYPILQRGADDAASQPVKSGIIRHYKESVKDRINMNIERRRVASALPTLRVLTERERLASEHEAAQNAARIAQLERDVKVAELFNRRSELVAQRSQFEQNLGLRVQRERLAMQLEIAALQRQINEQRREPKPQLTPAQQRQAKKAEIEGQLQQLRSEELRAGQQTSASELEKRRLQNMYAARRDELMEQLEKYL